LIINKKNKRRRRLLILSSFNVVSLFLFRKYIYLLLSLFSSILSLILSLQLFSFICCDGNLKKKKRRFYFNVVQFIVVVVLKELNKIFIKDFIALILTKKLFFIFRFY